MTQRKRLIAGLVVLICVAIASYFAFIVCTPASRVNPDNIQRIRAGMTEQEVVDILGPPRDRRVNAFGWDGDQWVADIYFDEHRLVMITSYGPQTTFLSKLRRWLVLK